MNIAELIDRLEDARASLGDEAEVRIAYQPNWPLRGTVAAVTIPQDDEEPHCEDHVCFVANCTDCLAESEEAEARAEAGSAPHTDNDDKMLWIAVGSSPYNENPYAPKWAWNGE